MVGWQQKVQQFSGMTYGERLSRQCPLSLEPKRMKLTQLDKVDAEYVDYQQDGSGELPPVDKRESGYDQVFWVKGAELG